MTHFLKTSELVEIYTLHKQGAKNTVIARKFGRSDWGISTALTTLSQYVEGKYPKQPRKAYMNAAQLINKQHQNGMSIQKKQLSTNGVSAKPIEIDRETDLKALDTAFSHLQEVIVDVIEHEAERRSREQVEKYKTQYEEERKRLEEIVDQMKESNLAASLRKRWKLFS